MNKCGLTNIWQNQFSSALINIKWIKAKVKLTLIDQFKQSWYSNLDNSPKALNYRIYKHELKFENYLDILTKKDAITFCKFRTCNTYLPIETGRWENISRENRICQKCNLNDIGDEFHYILNCSTLKEERKNCLKNKHIRNRNIISFEEVMSSKKPSFLRKLCIFIRKINLLCSPY